MKTRGHVVVAVGAGFLLRGWTAKLASSPEVAKLTESIRGELMTAAKAAAVTATSSRIDSLNNRLQSSAGHLVGGVAEEAGTRRRSGENHDLHVVEAEKSEEEPAGDESTEDEGDEQPEATGENDEGEETEQPEEEERPRRRPRTPRPRGGGTAKEVREWAVQQGYEISSRGRIPADIEQAFRDAH
ncbi:Lsr2 family DNA-binding protein [Rhodococcus sp. LB1]|uniref:Lsr2 family DNA-binding protein n=2 Tax=Rhodococcus TaxID=1827 RepID=UPI00077B190A|nr:histone-like nucleoid-structuring protein Lsr2 [Rhodococcus sp. LB1]KXX62014.1 hypothetical protein AZG88_04245 [Rhodococcus sp. LB1]